MRWRRTVYTTVNNRARSPNPTSMKRLSPLAYGSSIDSARSSNSALAASSKETPCFLRFAPALASSNSISNRKYVYYMHMSLVCRSAKVIDNQTSVMELIGLATDRYDFCRKYARKELKQAANFNRRDQVRHRRHRVSR